MNKEAGYNNPSKPKTTFKWVLMAIISATSPMFLTIETNFITIF